MWFIRYAYILPVSKAKTTLVWRATEEDYDADNDQTDDGDQFDAREPELCFSEERNCDDVEDEDDA